ncbi:alpha/beta hydrolase [Marinomonas sp. C2222]|uniref:Alpha/beta hydrolase n=1 Tax=Marinomonas sargassi TaxID=2984494 RepID=A0ABT2YRJ0_9GAMM|nr:alpha/beta hydrolase [Marinomonas sargassi]MCV2402502.1 alpha/beta hydrolase [Marinomonas sargassi]
MRKNQATIKQLNNAPELKEHHTLALSDYSLHYVEAIPSHSESNHSLDKESLVFVHGTPGSWEGFAQYFLDEELKQDFYVYSMDRPGWGGSTYPNSRFPSDLAAQSALIGPMLESIWRANDEEKVILVGHSLGGSLVPKLAADYPHLVKGIVILAGDLDPALAEARWFNKLFDWLPDFILPAMWRHSNDEVMAIQPSLAEAQYLFSQLDLPIVIVQGKKDGLVRPGSAVKAPNIFTSADLDVVFLEEANHIIHLTHAEEVKKAIYRLKAKF